MYTPPSNRESRPEVLRDLIGSYSFGTLVTTGDAGPEATHLPSTSPAPRLSSTTRQLCEVSSTTS